MAEVANRRKKQRSYFDFTLLFILLFLLGFGLVMVYSTSSYSASLDYNDGLFFLRKQLISMVIGLVMMFIISFIKFDIYKALAPFVYVVSIIMVLLVKSPLGHKAKGATRWIYIGGFSIQPAEVVKIGVIMITAFLIIYLQNREDIDNTSFKYIFIVLAPGILAAGLILFVTKNFSTAVIIGGIAFSMLIMSS
ncbi:MAG: FtsW/RodA/SpoVE family cell cycle protein, partial [Lachnospiraceae bacterium]|nr:FtsW/RodA/SpoVE family cell cycle protein [Lachnospiraceae bacterium]